MAKKIQKFLIHFKIKITSILSIEKLTKNLFRLGKKVSNKEKNVFKPNDSRGYERPLKTINIEIRQIISLIQPKNKIIQIHSNFFKQPNIEHKVIIQQKFSSKIVNSQKIIIIKIRSDLILKIKVQTLTIKVVVCLKIT